MPGACYINQQCQNITRRHGHTRCRLLQQPSVSQHWQEIDTDTKKCSKPREILHMCTSEITTTQLFAQTDIQANILYWKVITCLLYKLHMHYNIKSIKYGKTKLSHRHTNWCGAAASIQPIIVICPISVS